MIRTMNYRHTTKTLKELIDRNGLNLENIRRGISKYTAIVSAKGGIDTALWSDEETLGWLIGQQASSDDMKYYNNFK